MTYQEKNIAVSLFTSVLVFAIYFTKIYQMYLDGRFEGIDAASLVGKSIFIVIGVSIVVSILTTIVFNIIFAIATNDSKPSFVVDERDKLIELKGMQFFFVAFSVGFMVSVGALALGVQPYLVFILIIGSMFVGSAIGDVTKLTYYRRGL